MKFKIFSKKVFKEHPNERQDQKDVGQDEARLKRAELFSKSGNWEIDISKKIISASIGAKVIYGKKGDEWNLFEIQQIPLPEYREKLDLALHNLVENNEPYNIEFKIKNHVTGRIIDVHSKAEYDKESHKVFGTIQDITERKKIEGELISSEIKFTKLFNLSSNPMAISRFSDNVFVEVNSAFIEESGYTIEELIGKTPLELGLYANPADRDKMYNLFRKNGELQNYEMDFRTKSGKIHTCLMSLMPMYDQNTDLISIILHDITDRKQVEQALKESEERFRKLFDLSPIGSVMVGLDQKFLRCNESFCNFLGYSEQEIIGKTVAEVTYPDDVHLGLSDLQSLIKGEVQIVQTQKRYIHKQSHIVWGEVSIRLQFDTRGRPAYFITVIQDITERKQAEKALRESQQRMKDIIEFLPDALFAVNLEGQIIAWNRAIQEMTGIKAEDMLGKGNYEYAIPFFGKRHPLLIDFIFKDHPDQISNYNFINREGDSIVAESSICIVNGRHLDLFGKAGPLYDVDGNLAGAIQLVRDITESKKNIELLKEKDIIFQSFMDFSPIYVFFKDHNIRAVQLSKNFEKMLGRPLSEILGKTMDELFPSDMAKKMVEDDKQILFEGKLIQVEEELNGRYYTTIKFPIKHEGSPTMLAGFTIDITERKLGEQELIMARNKAEQSDRLKDAFLQNMSHEIRTPLNAIIGFSDLLRERDNSIEKLNHYSTIICNSSNQLLSIVNDILTISRIQTEQEIISEKEVNVNDILNDLLAIFEPLASKKNILLTVTKFFKDEDSIIITDDTKLIQIITNLLSNAIKFTHTGGIEFGYILKDKVLEFFVKDTGIGIKPELQELIFERFAQADISISKKYGGTGLGLSISKSFAVMLGGSIRVESDPIEDRNENGTVFYVTIPYIKAKKVADNTIVTVSPKKDITKTILIVEDGEYNYLLIKSFLDDTNYKLLHARNGIEAIELFKKYPQINLILMDIKMPVMDGETALKKIKKLKPDIPVIAQTAYAQDQDRDHYIDIGFDEFILKPISKKEFHLKTQKYL